MKRHIKQGMATKLTGMRLQTHQIVFIVAVSMAFGFLLSSIVLPMQVECQEYVEF